MNRQPMPGIVLNYSCDPPCLRLGNRVCIRVLSKSFFRVLLEPLRCVWIVYQCGTLVKGAYQVGAGFRHLRQDFGRRFSVTAKVRAEHQLDKDTAAWNKEYTRHVKH